MQTTGVQMRGSNEFRYDVFISYSHADKTWVREELLSRLEAEGLTVCIDFRDFELGAPSVTEMERAVLESRKTVPVLTHVFLKSAWTEFETVMLQTLDPGARQRRLIPLRKEPCELPLRLRALTYIDFTDPQEVEFAWARLLSTLAPP